MPDNEQLEQFKQAVEDKNAEAEAKAENGPQNPHGSAVDGDVQADLTDAGTPQDTGDVRAKSSRHGNVTADKWNQ